MLTPKTLKILLGLKVALVFAILLSLKGGLYVGDKETIAADNDDPTEDVSDSEKSEDEFVYNDDGSKRRKRKSFLDKLLKIPQINTDELKKEEIAKYLAVIERKKQQVENRIETLRSREEKLIKIEEQIDDKLRKLDDERRFFAETIQQEKSLKDERTKQLVEFYKKMPPKKAAPVFEKLDKDLVVELFNQIPEKQTMKILSLMNPEKSVELTEYYGRLRSGREYEILQEMNRSLREEFQDCKGMPEKTASR